MGKNAAALIGDLVIIMIMFIAGIFDVPGNKH